MEKTFIEFLIDLEFDEKPEVITVVNFVDMEEL